jgi:hypothetical protein
MRLLSTCSIAILIGLSGNLVLPLSAQDGPETVLEGLKNPCGIAIQPETGDLFIADSGAARIIRVVDGKAENVIVDFPLDVYGKGPMYDIGPLGLAFVDKDTLVVGGGGKPDGEELLRVYQVPEKGAEAIKADDMLSSNALPATDDIKGEGNFYALAIAGDHVFVTCNGDDTKGWVSRALLEGNKTKSFERFIATKEATEVDAPVGIAIEPTAGHLAVGQMGEITVPGDSLLTFYSAKDGRMLSKYETGLSDIDALAYSADNQLYALDFSWHDTTQGGLFHLISDKVDGQPMVKSVKVMNLDKPTAMVFAEDGSLYITIIGTTAEGDETPGGKLLKLKPEQLKAAE